MTKKYKSSYNRSHTEGKSYSLKRVAMCTKSQPNVLVRHLNMARKSTFPSSAEHNLKSDNRAAKRLH